MQKFHKFTGIVAPMDRANIDTDAIIPNQYLKSIKRSGFDPRLTVDLEQQFFSNSEGVNMPFEVDEFRKYCLHNGVDDIGLKLKHAQEIKVFEQGYFEDYPWLK